MAGGRHVSKRILTLWMVRSLVSSKGENRWLEVMRRFWELKNQTNELETAQHTNPFEVQMCCSICWKGVSIRTVQERVTSHH